MRIEQTQFIVQTNGPGLYEITKEVGIWLKSTGITSGLLTVFIAHTSASLTIQENADPAVLADLKDFFTRLVPEGGFYRHQDEGSDDMPAHIKSALTQVSLGIPVANAEMLLGPWQGIYLFEHRKHPHRRKVIIQLMGE